MSIKVYSAMLCCYFVLNGACSSKSGISQNSSPASTPSPAVATSANSAGSADEAKPTVGASTAPGIQGLDACGLIEKSEIESVQGAKMQETIPSKRDADTLLISQCYYRVLSSDGSKDLSVHLEVTQNGPKSINQNSVGDLWRERFLGAKDTKDTEEKETEEMDQPKSVPGIGEGAYWMGNNKGGALYVFRKDKLVRISIGGPDDGERRIQKTKTLAEKVLKRLS